MAKMTGEEAFDVVTNLIVGGDINSWQVEALQYILNENAQLHKSLRWALNDMADGMDKSQTPSHYCGYVSEPLGGHCDFCEKYWTARELAFPEEFVPEGE